MNLKIVILFTAIFLSHPQSISDEFSEGQYILDTTQIDRFGSYSNFDTLPLKKGEYILTIDDGPYGQTTIPLIQILSNRKVPATFFMVGRRADRFPELVRMIRDAGFGIGSHGYSHADLTGMPLPQAAEDIRRGAAAVERHAGGLNPDEGRLFRFPSGHYSPELMDTAHSFGMVVSGVDISPEDWRGSPPSESLERFRNRLRRKDRGVIVLHDAQPNTIALLPMIIDEVHAQGGRFMKLVPSGSPPSLD